MLKFIIGISKYIIYTFQFVIVGSTFVLVFRYFLITYWTCAFFVQPKFHPEFQILGALMILFGLLPIVHGGYDSIYSKVAVGLGVAVFIIAFLGCFGAIRENRLLLIAHAVILLILFIIQIALAIILAVAIGNGYFDDMTSTLDKVFTDDHKLFNNLQLWLDCCGVRNFTDYVNNNQPFPGSCCGESDDFDASGERSCEIGYVFYTGCVDTLKNYFEDNFRWISGIAIGFAVFEILAAVFTFWTSYHLRKK